MIIKHLTAKAKTVDYMDDLNEWAVSMKSEDQFRTFEKTGQLPAPRSRTGANYLILPIIS